jgi:hypothetical protein
MESIGLKVKVPMILQVDNQGVRELINNWSVGGHMRHVATKAMFLQELKEQGLLSIEYISGKRMISDLFTKNLQGLYLQGILFWMKNLMMLSSLTQGSEKL